MVYNVIGRGFYESSNQMTVSWTVFPDNTVNATGTSGVVHTPLQNLNSRKIIRQECTSKEIE